MPSTKTRQPTITLPDRTPSRYAGVGARREISCKSVFEIDGRPVKSVRKSLASAAMEARLGGVTPYLLRHTAGPWTIRNSSSFAEAGDFEAIKTAILPASNRPPTVTRSRPGWR